MDIFKNKSNGMRLLIVLLAPAYIVLFGELFMRLFAGVALMPRYVTGGDDGIRRNIPESVYGQTSREVDIEIRVNSQGMRADRDYALQKPKDVCRIAVLGDSFFMGYEVDLEHSFGYLLEANLASLGKPCEVLNFSVSGFGTAEYVVALQSRVLQYDPDLVIFELHETDLRENVISDLYRLQDGLLVRTGNNYLPAIAVRDKLMQYSVYRWLIEHSQLYSVVREHAGKTVKKILLLKNQIKLFFSSDQNAPSGSAEPENKAQELLVNLLEQGRQISNESGAEFMLVEIPNGFDPPNYISILNTSMREYQLDKRFNLASPYPVFMDPANADELYYYQTGHLHLSIKGNKVVADVAARTIVEKKLLSEQIGLTSPKPFSATALSE
ncbi:MAG: hypothetical protein AAF404_13025 [Pseudomonadota bacterium]